MVLSVSHDAKLDIHVLNRLARLAVIRCSGAGNGNPESGGFSMVYLPDDASAPDIALINAMYAAWDTLSINATLSVIPNDDTTVTTLTISTADSSLGWMVIDSEGSLVGQGDVTPVAGVVTLTFKTSVADVYNIWVHRKTGDFACGMVQIVVSEA